ncbi:MAG: cell division protein SepF [Methanotrichaceae archaeon]|nr:cell division protein SepF [Methanotrichaceae archaeon]
MAGFLEKLKLIGKPTEEDYSEVDLGQFEEAGGSPDIILRVAELGRIEILPEIKQEIYAGNIVLVDIAGLKRDKAALDRAIGELKKAVDDVSGDIAGIGDDLIVLVPSGIKIDREKVVGSKD